MTTFLVVIHVIVCIALIGLVLIQRGRGAGLVESFAGVESMFGTKTNAFLTKATTVLSVAFFITCLLLAVVSVRQSKSLMGKIKTQAPVTQPATATTPDAPASTSQPATQPTQDAPKAQ
jgi:preprotein translocase subunit SecG